MHQGYALLKMKTLISIIILALTFSCKNKADSSSSIKGNWVYSDSENMVYYAEIYVGESIIHIFDTYYGYSSFQYQLVNDSIFSIHPESGQKFFVGATNENGDFQFPYIDNKISLKYKLEEQDDEYTLEEYVKDIKIVNGESLYALYQKDAGARQMRLYKKVMSSSQYERYLNPPASHIDTSLSEVEPILPPK